MKRSILWAGMVVLLAVGIVLWGKAGPKEPVYQGKGLRHWLGILAKHESNPSTDQAYQATRDIGAEAVPWLTWKAGHDGHSATLNVLKLFPSTTWAQRITEPLAMRAFRSYQMRVESVKMLGQIGPAAAPAIPVIAPLLSDPNEWVSRDAAAALMRMLPASLPALSQATSDPSVQVRRNTFRGLDLYFYEAPSGHGEDYEALIRILLKGLDDADLVVRTTASEKLKFTHLTSVSRNFGCIVGPEVVNAPLVAEVVVGLTKALDDPDKAVRRNAAEGLLSFRSDADTAIPKLIEHLGDPSPDMRLLIASGISEKPAHRELAIPPLRKLAAGPDRRIRIAAAAALSELQEQATNVVEELIAELKDEEPDVRRNAMEALETIGAPGATAALPAMLDALFLPGGVGADPESLASGFARFGGESLPYVVKALDHPDPQIRLGAVATFYYDDPRIEPALRKLEHDPDPTVREAVYKRLERFNRAHR